MDALRCDGLLLNWDGGIRLEHQMNSMMAEIVKLQRDVVDLNKEIGKKIYQRQSAVI